MSGLSGVNNRLGGIQSLGGVQGLSGVRGLGGLDNNLGFGGLNGVQGLNGLTGLNGIKGTQDDIGIGAGAVGISKQDHLGLGQDRYSGRYGVNYGGSVGYKSATIGYAPQKQGKDIGYGKGSYFNSDETLGYKGW